MSNVLVPGFNLLPEACDGWLQPQQHLLWDQQGTIGEGCHGSTDMFDRKQFRQTLASNQFSYGAEPMQ